MTAITYRLLGVLLLCYPVAADEPLAKQSPVTEQDIQQAIESLDSDSFQAREKAAKDLWGFGEQAKPALLKVAETGSLEASGRAKRILANIDLGITPDTPIAQTVMLRQFQSSTQAERAAALSAMLKQGDIETVSKLIDRIDDPDVKQNLFRQSFRSSTIMTKLAESHRIDWWIQKAIERDVNIRRHDVIVAWLAREDTLRELRDKDNLSIIEAVFAQEPHDASRFALAKSLLAESRFVDMFVKDANIDRLLRVFELPTDPGGRRDLLLTLIRGADGSAIFEPGAFRKIMRFASGKLPAASINEVKLACLHLISPQDLTKHLSVATFTELCSGLTVAEFERWFNQASKQPTFLLWMTETDHFRPILDWASNLPKSSRDRFVVHVTEFVAARQGVWEKVLSDPSTLEVHWQLIHAIADQEQKRDLLFSLAPVVVSDSHRQSEPRKQLIQLIMSTQTPSADSALTAMLRQTSYRERIYDRREDVQTHLHRCGQFAAATNESVLSDAYQSVFSANSLRGYFAEPRNSRWILDEYLPSLSAPKRQLAVQAICGSDRLLQTWQRTPFLKQVLDLASEQSDLTDRAACIASVLRYDQLAHIDENDPKIRLLNLYRDESLPDAARAAFIKTVASNQAYLRWLSQNGQADEFIDIVERFASQPGLDMKSLYRSTSYIGMLAKQDRLESWIAFLEQNPGTELRLFSMLIQQPSFVSPEFMERYLDRLARLTNLIDDPRERGELLAAVLLSPSSLSVHQRKHEVGALLQRIGSRNDPVIQGALFRSLSRADVMNAIVSSRNLDALVAMIKRLPDDRGPAALSLISNPILLDHLNNTGQVDLLFEIISRQVGGSSIYTNRPVIQLLIEHGYIDRLLKGATTSKDRELLAARVLSSSTAVAYYAKERRLRELVNLFEQLELGMTRDTALRSLFQQPDLALSLCKEIGAEKSAALIDTISYSFYLAQARSNFVIALCEIEKVSEPRLRQLLVDIENSGLVGEAQRQRLVEGAVGEQLIVAGLLPQIKQTFLKTGLSSDKRPSKPLDDLYTSVLVLKHLIEDGQAEEFIKHVRSIPDPQDVAAMANRLIASDAGCELLLSSKGFTYFAAMIGGMSEYDQGHYWRSFCGNPKVIHYVSYSADIDGLFRYLIDRKQTRNEIERLIVQIAQDKQLGRILGNRVLVNQLVASLPRLSAATQASVASHLSRDVNAIWRMVETGQWDSFVSIIQCERTEELRASRWRACTQPHLGLISALISADQREKAIQILQQHIEPQGERDWTKLWIRLSTGTLPEDMKAMEASSKTLQPDDWRWLAWAYRAQGNNEKAIKAAIRADDDSLLTALAIEQGDWAEAALLLSKSPAPQPHIQPKEDEALRLEHEGMLLVTRLYAQQHDQLQTPIDAILDIRSTTKNLRVRSRCCDALLLGEQFASALSFIDQNFIHRALRLRLYQGDHSSAIDVTKWNPRDPQAFLTTIRRSTGSDAGAMQATVELLSALNHEQRQDEMGVLHEAMIKSLLENSSGVSGHERLVGYAMQLYRHGLYDLFWPTLEQMDVVPLIVSGLLSTHSHDELDRTTRLFLPRVAYGPLPSRAEPHDSQTAIAALQTVDKALRLNSIPKQRLDQWVDDLTRSPDVWMRRADEALAVGVTCLRQERLEDATRILLPLEQTYPMASEALARAAWQREDWVKAAIHYDRLNLTSRDRIDAMYLSGLALSRSGEVDTGTAKMASALKIAFHPVSQMRLGIELVKLDEMELGNRFLRAVVRLVPHHSATQLEAIAHLKATASSPADVLKWCQQWQLLQTRYVYGNGEQAEFLRVPFMLHGSLAQQAFLNEDWQRVGEELAKCRTANDGDSDFYGKWIKRLRQAGQTELADRLGDDDP